MTGPARLIADGRHPRTPRFVKEKCRRFYAATMLLTLLLRRTRRGWQHFCCPPQGKGVKCWRPENDIRAPNDSLSPIVNRMLTPNVQRFPPQNPSLET
jgi:hypothetical protein